MKERFENMTLDQLDASWIHAPASFGVILKRLEVKRHLSGLPATSTNRNAKRLMLSTSPC